MPEKVKTPSISQNGLDPGTGFKALFHALPIPASITTLREGRFIDVNKEYEIFFGFKLEEMVGKTLFDLNMIVDVKKRRRLISDVMKMGKIVDTEYELRTRSGEIRTMLMSLQSISLSGQQCGFALLMNLTPQKLAEKALRQSRRQLRLALEGASLGTWEYDPACRSMGAWNPRMYQLFQIPPESLDLEKRMIERVYPRDRARLKQEFEQTSLSGHLDHVFRIVRDRGRIAWIRICGHWVGTEEGRPAHISGISEDITALKESEQILKKTNAVLEKRVSERTAELRARNFELQQLYQKHKELSHNILHLMESDRRVLAKELHDSIGGTLAAIMYSLEGRVVQMSDTPPPDVITFERIIEHLINCTRETRRIAKQLRPATLDDLGLAAAIRDNLSEFKEFYRHIETSFHAEMAEEGIDDDIKIVLFRVVQEALNNVGRHSHANRVDIELSREGEQVELQVVDDGCGFPVERQADGAAGIEWGYGLRNMRERVEVCRGSFKIESSQGKGTRIRVVIPIDPNRS